MRNREAETVTEIPLTGFGELARSGLQARSGIHGRRLLLVQNGLELHDLIASQLALHLSREGAGVGLDELLKLRPFPYLGRYQAPHAGRHCWVRFPMRRYGRTCWKTNSHESRLRSDSIN